MHNTNYYEEIKSVKSKIERLIENGHLKEAMAALDMYDEKFPGDPDICSMRAVIHILEGDADKAEEVLLEGLKKDSVHFDLLYNLAYIYEQRGQLQKAMELYCKADTVADASQKANIGEAVARLRLADSSIEPVKRDRIVFFCRPGLDNFLEDTVKGLSDDYFVRKIIVSDLGQIEEGMEWADVCWFEWCDDLLVHGSRLPLARLKKIICRLHRYEVFTYYPGEVTWENVDKLVIVTRHLEDIIRTNWPDIPERVEITVIENGVDTGRYAFRERSKGFNLAMVGYIHSRKNPVLILQIMKKLVGIDKRYRLYVAGTFQEQLAQMYWDYQVRRMGLEGNVIFEGWQKDISSWLEDKDYLVSASIHESFGYAIAEAMARGIKPVIHDFLHADEIWPEEFLFNTVDEAVASILSDDYDSHKYRDFIIKNYPLEKQLDNTRKLIDEMLSFKKILSRVRDMLDGGVRPVELQHEDITVLIPNYNRARMIMQDLDAGLKLGSQPKVIVDDSSTEETEWLDKIIETDRTVKVIRKEKNSGVAESRKTGLQAIGTRYTTFIDDDNAMICLDREAAHADISTLEEETSLVVPRYIINSYRNRFRLGYDRRYFNGKNGYRVLEYLAKTGEMMGLLTGGAIGHTGWMAGHASCPMFKVSEDFVMLARMMADKPDMKIKITEELVFVRRLLDEGLTLSRNSTKLALELIAQAIACYYCLELGIADMETVLRWMKDRASLIQRLYNFGDSFETELIAYLTGEISEEVFIHFLRLHGIMVGNTLDELAPELKKMRGLYYIEKAKSYKFHSADKQPLVSVIITTFNRREMLKKAIDQVLKQDYSNIEVIVADDCSEDGTEEMIRNRYKDEKRLIYHRNNKNVGPFLNFNYAFQSLAKGYYCLKLNDDNYFIDSTYLSKAVSMLNANDKLAFVAGGVYHDDKINSKIYRVMLDVPEVVEGKDLFINFTSLKYPIMPDINTLVFRRENAIKAGILQGTTGILARDLFIELRLLMTGDAGFLKNAVLVYTYHEGMISLNPHMSVGDSDYSYIDKVVTNANLDIGELIAISNEAKRVFGIDAETVNKWLMFRIWKYMYWRINTTARSEEECRALLRIMHASYPGIYDNLKEVAVRRFGWSVLDVV